MYPKCDLVAFPQNILNGRTFWDYVEPNVPHLKIFRFNQWILATKRTWLLHDIKWACNLFLQMGAQYAVTLLELWAHFLEIWINHWLCLSLKKDMIFFGNSFIKYPTLQGKSAALVCRRSWWILTGREAPGPRGSATAAALPVWKKHSETSSEQSACDSKYA